MELTDNTNTIHHDSGRDDTPRAWYFRGRSMSPTPADERAGADSQGIGVFNNIPMFLDRTFRMIDNVPDEVACWSTAGDSFIIKQVLVFEQHLPSYFNHKKFMSFVRQLNFYCFKKTKASAWACLRSADNHEDTACGDGAAAKKELESESWEAFRHPLFRRGRRDLLAGIKRQKYGGRLKRKRADAQESDIVSTLVTDVEALSGDLKAVEGKLDSITSLLLNMTGGQNRAIPGDAAPRSRDNVTGDEAAAAAADAAAAGEGGGGGGGGASFSGGAQSGNTASFVDAEPLAATPRGGYGQWLVGGWSGGGSGGGGVGGSIRRGGHDPYAYGAVLDYRAAPRDPADKQLHGWQGQLLHSRPPQQPYQYDAGHYPVMANQKRYHVEQSQPLPSLSAAVEARASKSASIGPSRQQLPPLRLSPPRLPESVTSSSSEGKQGGTGQRTNSPNASHPRRGDGGGGGVGTSPSSAPADADPYDEAQQQQQQRRRRRRRWRRQQDSSIHPTQETANVVVDSPRGGRRGAAAAGNQTHQRLSDGTRSMLHALSAASVAETDKRKHANSITSTGSTGSINSTSTQSLFEYN